MKRIIFFCFISLIALISPSCKKTADGPVSFTATIKGSSIKGSVSFSTTNVTETTLVGSYDFLASGSNNSTISLYLLTVSAGVYGLSTVVNTNPGIGVVYNGKNYANGFSSRLTVSPGTIDVTSNTNSSIDGTFSAVLYNTDGTRDSVIVTNGAFTNLVYQ